MTTPMPQEQQDMMMGPQSPITMEQLMQLRNSAMGAQDMSGAAGRRLGTMGQDPNAIVDGKSPEDLMLDQAAQDQQVEPPDINPESAKTMMMYGSVLDFLMRAKGEIPSGQ